MAIGYINASHRTTIIFARIGTSALPLTDNFGIVVYDLDPNKDHRFRFSWKQWIFNNAAFWDERQEEISRLAAPNLK